LKTADHSFHSDLPEHPVTSVRWPTARPPSGHGAVPWTEVFGLLAKKAYTAD
jgi:hypothetical protein